MNYEDDDELDGLEEKANEIRRMLIDKSKKEFVEGCYEAYEMLATVGPDAVKGTSKKSIQSAINRMTALFLAREEYERCQFLKSYVAKHLPGFEIEPDPSVEKELSL